MVEILLNHKWVLMKDGHLEGSIGDFQKDGALRYYDKANFEKADYGAW